MVCLTPLLVWRQIHFEHHRWVGIKDRDPTAAGLITFEQRQQHLRPTVALLQADLGVAFAGARHHFHGQCAVALPTALMEVGATTAGCCGCCIGFILGAAPCAGHHALGVLAYASIHLPVLLASFIWYETINLTHHAGLYKLDAAQHPDPLPLHEQQSVSRSCYIPTWLSTGAVLSLQSARRTPSVSGHPVAPSACGQAGP